MLTAAVQQRGTPRVARTKPTTAAGAVALLTYITIEEMGLFELSRIAQLDQRTALPDQCLHSAEADVRPPRRKSGFDPERTTANPQTYFSLEA